jgi:cytochrome c oxidase assembly protein subunit 15
MTQTQTENSWLSRYAVLTAFATLLLICVGGLVTSHGAGMAVPDWPNTFGYNPFFFPFSKWVGNVFYEHSHRLVASAVGLMTVILAVWLWVKERRCWVRWLGVIALFTVVLQGVLGGLRVVLFKDELGIFHATLAQLFFVLVCSIALLTTRAWRASSPSGIAAADRQGVRTIAWIASAMILGQLILGATMRHQHAGLAIPDFPTAYGKWWPDTDPASIATYNQQRMEVTALNPITRAQIVLQMIHRLTAAGILAVVIWCAIRARRDACRNHPVSRLTLGWLGIIFVQVLLGAATVWTGKSADIATAHVAVGALSLATGVVIVMVVGRTFEPADQTVPGRMRLTDTPATLMAGMAASRTGKEIIG